MLCIKLNGINNFDKGRRRVEELKREEIESPPSRGSTWVEEKLAGSRGMCTERKGKPAPVQQVRNSGKLRRVDKAIIRLRRLARTMPFVGWGNNGVMEDAQQGRREERLYYARDLDSLDTCISAWEEGGISSAICRRRQARSYAAGFLHRAIQFLPHPSVVDSDVITWRDAASLEC